MERTPLLRIAKRESMAASKTWLIRFAAFCLAILIGFAIFAALGVSPVAAYGIMIQGSWGKKTVIRQVIKYAIPLLGMALALAPCFKMRYWNIGGEGQITIGAMAATFFALNCSNLPPVVLLILMAASGTVFGGLWGTVPARFKARWGTTETLFTLMMNYIAIGIVKWLQGGPWEGKPGSQIIPNFAKSAYLPTLFGVHIGWIFVLILVVVMFVYMKYTKHGYEVAVLGESENTARYAGMNVRKITIRTAFLSGAIAGFVGFLVVSGADHTLADGVAAGVGFTAITVCWLAQLNPFAMIAISLLLSTLSKGAATLQTKMNIPTSLSDIITAAILLCMLGCEFFINYRLIPRGRHEKEVR